MYTSNIFDKCRAGLRPLLGLTRLVLEQDCALCGAASGQALLCSPCRSELPALGARCPRCAMPGNSGAECGRCLRRPPQFHATHAALRYAFPADRLILSLKYGARLPVAALLADLLAGHLATSRQQAKPSADIDLVMPMPLHPRRLATRGFNPAAEIGRRVAGALALPFARDLALRVRDTPAQADLPLRMRRTNVRGAFACRPQLAGRSVAVVDDVMTSGTTLDELARALKGAGARHVECWVVARTWPRDGSPGWRKGEAHLLHASA
ncbi:MAG: ComF family protein [Betaproteobacteria bacterium]|nr:ComF family protein [Betaproteobacteria bacterium]